MPLALFAREVTYLDLISPLRENSATVKNGDLWGGIDFKGTPVLELREDLITVKLNGREHVIFNLGRCMITNKVDSISLYGFVNYSGNVILKPQFQNFRLFNDGLAIKPNSDAVELLSEDPPHSTLSKDFIAASPELKSIALSESVFAFKANDRICSIKKYKLPLI